MQSEHPLGQPFLDGRPEEILGGKQPIPPTPVETLEPAPIPTTPLKVEAVVAEGSASAPAMSEVSLPETPEPARKVGRLALGAQINKASLKALFGTANVVLGAGGKVAAAVARRQERRTSEEREPRNNNRRRAYIAAGIAAAAGLTGAAIYLVNARYGLDTPTPKLGASGNEALQHAMLTPKAAIASSGPNWLQRYLQLLVSSNSIEALLVARVLLIILCDLVCPPKRRTLRFKTRTSWRSCAKAATPTRPRPILTGISTT